LIKIIEAQLNPKSLTWIACVIGLSLLVNAGNACPASANTNRGEGSGPISIVNQSPIQLLFLQAIPDDAETLPRGQSSLRFNTTLTNTLLSQTSENYTGVIDMEMIRTSLELQYGVWQGVEVGTSLPFVYSYSGFMDQMILDFEEFFFDSTRTARVHQEAYNYEYYIRKDNKPLISGEKRCSGIGDLVLRAKGKICDEGRTLPALSTRVAFKVPTGEKDRALGSGEPDYGFGLLLQKDIKTMTAYLNADVIVPGDAFDQEGVSLREFYEVMLGLEYKVSSRTSLLAQLNYVTRPFKGTGLQMLDRRIYDLLLGIHYLTEGGVFFQGGAIEDFNRSWEAGADITFFLNVGKNF